MLLLLHHHLLEWLVRDHVEDAAVGVCCSSVIADVVVWGLLVVGERLSILVDELAAVLFVTKSHRTCLVCQRVEKFSYRLLIFHGFHWQLALGDKEFELLLLLASNMVQFAANVAI